MIEREKATWSFNVASGYADAVNRWEGHLENAIEHLKYNRIAPAQDSMAKAMSCMNEANVWFNQANNQQFRIEALVSEIKGLRRGVAVTYVLGHDPIKDDWKAS